MIIRKIWFFTCQFGMLFATLLPTASRLSPIGILRAINIQPLTQGDIELAVENFSLLPQHVRPTETHPLIIPESLHAQLNQPDYESLIQNGRAILRQSRSDFNASIILLIFLVVSILLCLTYLLVTS